jgi:hypothetical protein
VPTERPALPTDRCTCGRPAVVVYLTETHGEVGYCGVPDGGCRGGAEPSMKPKPGVGSVRPRMTHDETIARYPHHRHFEFTGLGAAFGSAKDYARELGLFGDDDRGGGIRIGDDGEPDGVILGDAESRFPMLREVDLYWRDRKAVAHA